MALPIGFLLDLSSADENVKLQVSMQIVGPLNGEDKILKVGYAYEKVFDWRKEYELSIDIKLLTCQTAEMRIDFKI